MSIMFENFKRYAIANNNSIDRQVPFLKAADNVNFEFAVADKLKGKEKLVQIDNIKSLSMNTLKDILGSLVSVKVTGIDILDTYLFKDSSLIDIDFSNNVKNIGLGAFQNCRNLRSIINSESVTATDTNAFENCENLKNISIPKVLIIGPYTFSNCISLSSVNIENAEIIDSNAFANCNALKHLNIPNVKELGDLIFKGKTSLLSVKFNKLTKLGEQVFANCTSLSGVYLPTTLSSIGPYVFDGCTNLSTLAYGANLTNEEFDSSALSTLQPPQFVNNAQIEKVFRGLPDNWTITVPPHAYWNFMDDPVWKIYGNPSWDGIADNLSENQHIVSDDKFKNKFNIHMDPKKTYIFTEGSIDDTNAKHIRIANAKPTSSNMKIKVTITKEMTLSNLKKPEQGITI